jgi:hypothetical protein
MTTASAASRSLVRTVAIALVAGLSLLLSPALAAQAAGDDVTWTVRTASNGFGADRTTYGYTVDPGSTVEDGLVIANHGDTPLDLSVYTADGYTTDAGQFDLLVAGAESVGVGAWVSAPDGTVTIPAGKTVTVPFTVSIPDNATPGDYAGGIVTSLGAQDDTAGISVDRRLGIRIALRVGGAITPGLAIEDQHIEWGGGFDPLGSGDATLTYTLHNTGNAILSARQSATASGPFGWFAVHAAEVPAPPQLLPGESWTVSVPVRDVPAVFWLAGTATVVPLVTDASGSTTPLDAVTATAIGAAVPWILLIAVLVVAALVVGALWLRRRRLAAAQAREEARVQEAVAQALAQQDENDGAQEAIPAP